MKMEEVARKEYSSGVVKIIRASTEKDKKDSHVTPHPDNPGMFCNLCRRSRISGAHTKCCMIPLVIITRFTAF